MIDYSFQDDQYLYFTLLHLKTTSEFILREIKIPDSKYSVTYLNNMIYIKWNLHYCLTVINS